MVFATSAKSRVRNRSLSSPAAHMLHCRQLCKRGRGLQKLLVSGIQHWLKHAVESESMHAFRVILPAFKQFWSGRTRRESHILWSVGGSVSEVHPPGSACTVESELTCCTLQLFERRHSKGNDVESEKRSEKESAYEGRGKPGNVEMQPNKLKS